MTVLQALDRYYGRMADRGEAEPLGFTRENISYALAIRPDGSVEDVYDLRVTSDKKTRPARMVVPRPKRTSNIQANFLWDKTAYAFGVDTGKSKRLKEEHAAFRRFHIEMLEGVSDIHSKALLKFFSEWQPERFYRPPFKPEMLDTSFVFRLEGEKTYFHEVAPLRDRWLASLEPNDAPEALCLVSGIRGPVEVGHPIIKGVEGAQTAGAYLVSFNADAYTSYGKMKDATNAPTSTASAARYGAALNGLLERSSRNRLLRPLGDASVVFWADASAGEAAAVAAEDFFARMTEPPGDETEAARLRDSLEKLAEGRPIGDLQLGLAEDTRFYVLGLAPNAARLSVRYWLDDNFEAFARRLAQHYADFAIEPAPWRNTPPSISRLLVKTAAPQEKFDNIPPLLAGELTRAVLTGARYPRTLLTAAIQRLRAGDNPSTGWHAAVIRAVLAREHRLGLAKETPPMSLNRENPDPAYQLGRLFAALEAAQRGALGKVNATIRDRYMGAASATPAGVFPLLMRGAQSHLGKMRKEGKGGGWIEREIEEINDHIGDAYPRSLKLEAQGRFFIGYYHQRKAQFAGRPSAEIKELEGEEDDDGQ